jgi:predicted N-acetyltransferase YhbS
MISGRPLARAEIQNIWAIDRSEVIEAVYYLLNGALVLKPEYSDMHGWPPGEDHKYTPLLEACHDHGGWFYGLFDDDQLIGTVVLAGRFMGKDKDPLQLKFLHISQGYRHQGWGRHLFDLAVVEARQRGAKRLYISATPSEHTIDFYLGLGCQVTAEPDAALWALEPDDIHLEYKLEPGWAG